MYTPERYTKAIERATTLIEDIRKSDEDIFHNIVRLRDLFDCVWIALEFDYMFPDKEAKTRHNDFKTAIGLIYHDVRGELTNLSYWAKEPKKYDEILDNLLFKKQWTFVLNKLFGLLCDYIENKPFVAAYNFYSGANPMGTYDRPIRMKIAKKSPDGNVKWCLTENDIVSFKERLEKQALASEYYKEHKEEIYKRVVAESYIAPEEIYKEYEDFIYGRDKKKNSGSNPA